MHPYCDECRLSYAWWIPIIGRCSGGFTRWKREFFDLEDFLEPFRVHTNHLSMFVENFTQAFIIKILLKCPKDSISRQKLSFRLPVLTVERQQNEVHHALFRRRSLQYGCTDQLEIWHA